MPRGRALDAGKDVKDGRGTLNDPYTSIPLAFAAAESGDVVRVVGNAGADGDMNTRVGNYAYEIGRNLLNETLADGKKLEVPQGVTLVVDPGAIFKLRGANVATGTNTLDIDRSESYLQVLGTPYDNVYFTSYFNTLLGFDTEPLDPSVSEGDWGGLVFQNDYDYEDGNTVLETEGIFLNYVNHADISYGGGQVNVNSIRDVYNPIHMIESRPTVTFNTIHHNSSSAMSADPNSFIESEYSNYFYTADYTRVGPEIAGNHLVANSINGLMIRVDTPVGGETEKLEGSARWDDYDIVHVVSESVIINGTPGGAVEVRGTSPLLLPAVQRIEAVSGLQLTDGDYFSISTTDDTTGETHTQTFEFNSSGGVLYGNTAIAYVPTDDPGTGAAEDIAADIAHAINSQRSALVFTDSMGNIREVDVATGRVTTTFSSGLTYNVDAGAAVVNDEIYVSRLRDPDDPTAAPQQELLVYDRGGSLLRTVPLDFHVSALAGDGGTRLYALPDDGPNTIVRIDPQTGGVLRQFPAPTGISLSPTDGLAFDGTSLYLVANSTERLYQIDPTTPATSCRTYPSAPAGGSRDSGWSTERCTPANSTQSGFRAARTRTSPMAKRSPSPTAAARPRCSNST